MYNMKLLLDSEIFFIFNQFSLTVKKRIVLIEIMQLNYQTDPKLETSIIQVT